MTLMELKKSITDKIVPSEFMIFVSKDCPFLANQYAKALGDLAVGGINKITSIYEPQRSSILLLTESEGVLNVLYTDTFDERSEDYSQFENTIVVCEQVAKEIDKAVENYVIKFPKLEDWQICDYAKTICSGVEENEIMWLVQASGNSIERVVNELDKVALFSKNDQNEILAAIRFDPQTDLYNTDIFAIVNAIVEGDMPVIYDFINHAGWEIYEPVMLVNRALTSLKNIIIVSQNPNVKADDCGVSTGQYKFIKYKYRSLNVEAAKQKLKFLTNFDLMLKTSQLDLNKRDMLSYVISNTFYKIAN